MLTIFPVYTLRQVLRKVEFKATTGRMRANNAIVVWKEETFDSELPKPDQLSAALAALTSSTSGHGYHR